MVTKGKSILPADDILEDWVLDNKLDIRDKGKSFSVEVGKTLECKALSLWSM